MRPRFTRNIPTTGRRTGPFRHTGTTHWFRIQYWCSEEEWLDLKRYLMYDFPQSYLLWGTDGRAGINKHHSGVLMSQHLLSASEMRRYFPDDEPRVSPIYGNRQREYFMNEIFQLRDWTEDYFGTEGPSPEFEIPDDDFSDVSD